MKLPKRYILLMGQDCEVLRGLEVGLRRLQCAVAIATSLDQAVAHMNQSPPDFVILTGNHQSWSSTSVEQLRYGSHPCPILIFALSNCPPSSWLSQSENPTFDGFLVNPVSEGVLHSLLQSAHARQSCCVV